MGTHTLYLDDAYLKTFTATVEQADGMTVVLDQTAFYPRGGGQPEDRGMLAVDGTEFQVTNVMKQNGMIVHTLDAAGLAVGDVVEGVIDWERRYRLMRMHTAAHIIDAVLYETGALATGNQLEVEKSRIDFSANVTKEQMAAFIVRANEIAQRNIELTIYTLKRDDAMKIEGIVKLANAMPPALDELRIVEIPGVDIQADGGTQVRRTGEIGTIAFLALDNRGKNNKRVYYTVVP